MWENLRDRLLGEEHVQHMEGVEICTVIQHSLLGTDVLVRGSASLTMRSSGNTYLACIFPVRDEDIVVLHQGHLQCVCTVSSLISMPDVGTSFFQVEHEQGVF